LVQAFLCERRFADGLRLLFRSFSLQLLCDRIARVQNSTLAYVARRRSQL